MEKYGRHVGIKYDTAAFADFFLCWLHHILPMTEEKHATLSPTLDAVLQQLPFLPPAPSNCTRESGREVDPYTFIYSMVCKALGLHAGVAQQKNLRLLVEKGSDDSPPRIGLTRHKFGREHDSLTWTICATHPEVFPRSLKENGLYEVLLDRDIEEQNDESPSYQVIGVWVETITLLDKAIKGFADAYAHAAGLG